MDYLTPYLGHLSFERGLSPLTRENYARDIRLLLSLVEQQALADISSAQIRRFVATLHGRGLSGKSIARLLSTWRGFYNYLVRHHGFTHNPCMGMKAPKSAKTLPQSLSVDQAVKLVSISGDEVLTLRDRAILELFYSSGLRLAELIALDIQDLELTSGTVTVTGKGNKTRIVPLGSHAIAAMQAWLQIRSDILQGHAQTAEQAVFIGKQGKRISGRAVQYRLKQWAVQQSIHSDVHPHMLRHSFASHVLQSSGDLRAVQEMLGHANISTTQVYTHLDFQHLAKVYDAAHPRARKK